MKSLNNMKRLMVTCSLLATLGLLGCQANTDNEADKSGGGKTITFLATQDDKPFTIDHALFNTPAAQTFLETGENPYIGKPEAIAQGKKVFQLYSCTQCHGPAAAGQVGPGLVGPSFRYAKDATNKGMFETIWHGTNGGMGAKGIGLMDASDPKNGLTPDEVLKVIAWIRSLSQITGNE